MLDDSKALNNQNAITNLSPDLIIVLEEKDNALTFKSCKEAQQNGEKESKSSQGKSKIAAPKASYFDSQRDDKLEDGVIEQNSSEPKDVLIARQFPFFAQWFDFSHIHPIEKQALPEFFQEKPSKTPVLYQRMRNFMVNLYWHNPKAYLTTSACRRPIRGDICAVLRVHAFLEHWGIINFCYKPSSIGWNALVAEKRWYPSLMRKDQVSLPQSENAALHSIKKEPISSSSKQQSFLNEKRELFRERNLTKISSKPLPDWRSVECQDLLVARIFEVSNVQRVICDRCLKPVGASWLAKKYGFYSSVKPQTSTFFNICQSCFAEDNFPIFYSKSDFFEVSVFDLTSPSSSEQERIASPWSVEEITVIAEVLKRENELDKVLKSITSTLKSRTMISILQQILKLSLFEISNFEESEDKIRENQFTFGPTLTSKLQTKTREILELLCEAEMGGSPSLESDEAHLPSLEAVTQRADEVSSLVSSIELKLAFFEEFEGILQRQKQSLRVLL